jgi:hypothetical protein
LIKPRSSSAEPATSKVPDAFVRIVTSVAGIEEDGDVGHIHVL